MWKMLVGFIVFAILAIFVLFKSGGDINMMGEAGGHSDASAPAEQAAPADAPAPAEAAPAASN